MGGKFAPNVDALPGLSLGTRRISGLLKKAANGGPTGDMLVYKTQLYQRIDIHNNTSNIDDNIGRQQLRSSRMEAMISEIYTESTTKVYGHCGYFSLTEYGTNFGSYIKGKKTRISPPQKLVFAKQLAKAISVLHSLKSTPIIYQDLAPCNTVLVNGQAKLIDFDSVVLLHEQRGDHQPCYRELSHPETHMEDKPIELLPRERRRLGYETTEKVDIYGLGHMFFFLLTEGEILYHCENPRGTCNHGIKGNNSITDSEVLALKGNDTLPSLPPNIEESNDPAIRIIRETMIQALRRNPDERPTAEQILETLNGSAQLAKSISTASGSTTIRTPQNYSCPALPAVIERNVTEPVYITSYPGSGSELTMNLIEAFTGTKTISHGGRCCDKPEVPYTYAALKTHYPWCCTNNFEHGLLSSAIVLIRNPMNSFPSKANRQYESDTGINSHSKQCPEKYWLEWRDKMFDRHLKLWEQLIDYWYESYPASNRFTLPYEDLVDNELGVHASYQMGRFLIRTGVVAEVDMTMEKADCVWREVVAADRSNRRSQIHRKKTYRPTFTAKQLNLILECIKRLLLKYRNEGFGPALEQYQHAIMAEIERQPTPKIAWLLSYPNSYNTKIRTLLQKVSNTTGATNYGSERIKADGGHTFNSESIPIFAGMGSGPFIINPQLPLPRKDGFILTKTHCGINGCFECNIPPLDQFLDACVSGISVDSSGKESHVKYNASVVERAVHLFLHPFANVLNRFNGANSKTYPKTKEGFSRWCHDYDDMYMARLRKKSPELIPLHVLNSNVPCAIEFYKWTSWHNHAMSVSQQLGFPVHVVHAEDFSATHDYDRSIERLLEFLNLEKHTSGYSFETATFTSYFNTTDSRNAILFIKHYASDELWAQLSARYFLSNLTKISM